MREAYCRDIGDLAGEMVKYFIIAGGVRKNITLSGIDTYTERKRYSYRRGDKTDRMPLHVRMNKGLP